MSENKKIEEMGPDEMAEEFGMDIPRLWATGARVVQGRNEVLIIFRDELGFNGGTKKLQRNVASLVIPKEIAAEIADILKEKATAEIPSSPGESKE